MVVPFLRVSWLCYPGPRRVCFSRHGFADHVGSRLGRWDPWARGNWMGGMGLRGVAQDPAVLASYYGWPWGTGRGAGLDVQRIWRGCNLAREGHGGFNALNRYFSQCRWALFIGRSRLLFCFLLRVRSIYFHNVYRLQMARPTL